MNKQRVVAAMVLLCLVTIQGKLDAVNNDFQKIPRGPAVILDGVISAGEWEHAARLKIAVAPDWMVSVLLQHDDKNLYVAFIGLRHRGAERYPEVLLDLANQKPLFWKQGQQWWLHASYNLCESNARPDDYAGCAPTKPGWDATRFPLKAGISEMAISLEKVGLSSAKPFGLALDVTDTKGQWSFWPESARLKIPMSWQTVRLE